MQNILADIVDRDQAGYTYLGTYEPWTSPPIGLVFKGLFHRSASGHRLLEFTCDGLTYDFYDPRMLGYDIKDYLAEFSSPEYTTSLFFVQVKNDLYRCNVINWD